LGLVIAGVVAVVRLAEARAPTNGLALVRDTLVEMR
jgi:hypothetical protein